MKTALITGGAGFIGSHMVDLLLSKNYCVRVVDNLVTGKYINLAHHSNNKNLLVDERDIRSLSDSDSLFKNLDYIFHFAGIGDIVPSIDKPEEYLSVNTQGTVKICEGAKFNSISKLVYAASSSCYGIAKVPTDEDAKIETEYPYALSKYLGECIVLHWSKVYKLPVNVIRIFNAYGTRSKTSGAYGAVFGVFLKQKLSGKPFTVVGDGTQKRDFLYVTDVANAFYEASITNKSGEIYNLGAGNPQSINYLVKLLGGPIKNIPSRPGEPKVTWANISKIVNDLNWEPKVSFEEGVKKILQNIDYWRDAPLWDEESIKVATKNWFDNLH
ncbi:MAG: NAD-dependent dehydratase [Alphaproteobacteria bacterium TMED62]|nr:MAG: NAD-dependent dehydratase [Alphaproteobacteria bacterium TMED62]|tara:strand:- start:5157 stop:6140 length:984 start_codon:yes stop_codon:yes gene_type:complete